MKQRQYVITTYQHFSLLPSLNKACRNMKTRVFSIDGLLLTSFTSQDHEEFATRQDAHFLLLVSDVENGEEAEQRATTIIEDALEMAEENE